MDTSDALCAPADNQAIGATTEGAAPGDAGMRLDGPPPDKCGGAWLMFLVMGVGLLFPWNAILQATDFFLYQFPCTLIEFDLSVAYMTSVLVTVVLALLAMNFFPKLTAVARVTAGFVLMLGALLMYGIAGETLSYASAVAGTVTSGIGDGLAQTGLYGMSSTLPPKYTTATMIGNGVSGVIVTVLRIATKQGFEPGIAGLLASTDMYFYIAAGFVVLCITCVLTIECVPMVKFYRAAARADAAAEDASAVALDAAEGSSGDLERAVVAARAARAVTRGDVVHDGGEDGLGALAPSSSSPSSSSLSFPVGDAGDGVGGDVDGGGGGRGAAKSLGLTTIRTGKTPLLGGRTHAASTSMVNGGGGGGGGGDRGDAAYGAASLRDRAQTAPTRQDEGSRARRRRRRSVNVDMVQRARAFSQRGALAFGTGRKSFLAAIQPKAGAAGGGGGGGSCCGGRRRGGGGGRCQFLTVLVQMKHHAAIVFTTYLLTLAMYPGEVLLIQPSNATTGLLQEEGWFSVLIIGTFNVGDLVGRFVPFCECAVPAVGRPAALWALALGRIAVILPLILVMSFGVVVSDVLAFATVFLLATTNGYVSTVAMMLGPQNLAPGDRELGGSIMVFCLLTGLTAGAFIGMGLGAANPPCVNTTTTTTTTTTALASSVSALWLL